MPIANFLFTQELCKNHWNLYLSQLGEATTKVNKNHEKPLFYFMLRKTGANPIKQI